MENEAITLVSYHKSTPTQSSLQFAHHHGGLFSGRSCKEHRRSRPMPWCTTIVTFSWRPLEHWKGPFHLPCLAARKALYANRSSVRNKLSVRPSGICIPNHLGREANRNLHSNSSAWGIRWMAMILLVGTNHFGRTWKTTGVNGETYSPGWKKCWFLVATILKDSTLSHGGRYMHFPVQARKLSELPCTCVNSTKMEL